MNKQTQRRMAGGSMFFAALVLSGCMVKAVGDPNRPITINAHITIDVRGLEKTASSIEDYVSGSAVTLDPQNDKGGKK